MIDEPIIHLVIKKIDKARNDTYTTILCQNHLPWDQLSPPGVGSTHITAVTCASCQFAAMKLKQEGRTWKTT
jgi:hypothetical protein